MRGDGTSPGGVVVEAEFSVSDASYPFVELSEAENCTVELEELLPRGDGLTAEYFSVTGTNPERALAFADREHVVDATLHVCHESGGIFEYVLADGCPVRYLAERGAVPTAVSSSRGAGRIVAEILPGEDASALVSGFLDAHAAELVAKRRKTDPTALVGEREIRTSILARLTDRQREVLFAAFDAGYYERPRETTGEALAAELDISPPTFQQHLRAAERKVVAFLAENASSRR